MFGHPQGRRGLGTGGWGGRSRGTRGGGERQRFAQGLGSLLIVNLREAAAAQAAQSVVDAKAESALAAAQFRAAMATDLP